MPKQFLKYYKEFTNMTKTKYIDYIKNRLFELFPNLPECLYSYDECSDTHFIYIPSKSVFTSDEFVKFNAESTLKYLDYSFDGTIAFISDITHMDYLVFSVFKNSYLKTSDWINNLVNCPIIIDDKILFDTQLVGGFVFANQDIFVPDFGGESNYSLAA